MKSNIFIPKKIKIGFDLRKDTYTGKLGYIIYHDGKVWRKEASWESWRQKSISEEEYNKARQENFDKNVKYQTDRYNQLISIKDENDYSFKQVKGKTLEEYLKVCNLDSIEKAFFSLGNTVPDSSVNPLEFENAPLDGFVLNKKAGGYSSGWNHRQTYCRVYDPRGFEFEITIPNLLYILENSTSIKGKGLEGKFIYGWEGKDLILIPEDAPEFKEMVEFTAIQELKVSKKDLKPGGIYMTSAGTKVTYLIKAKEYDYYGRLKNSSALWFYEMGRTYSNYVTKGIDSIKKYVEDNPDYANLLTKLDSNTNYKPTKEVNYEISDIKYLKDLVQNNSRYNDYVDVYIPTKKADRFSQVHLVAPGSYYNTTNQFYLRKTRRSEPFTDKYPTLEALISIHPLYKETIKKDEKE